MKLTFKLILVIFAILFLFFLGYEWWRSYPKLMLPVPMEAKSQAEKIDSILISTLNHYQLSGLSVGLVKNSEINYIHSIGYAFLEKKDSLTAQSNINIASLSKIFTALLIARQFSERGITLSSSLNELSPDLVKKYPRLDKLTLGEILSHQSGLRDRKSIASFLNLNKKSDLKTYVEKELSRKKVYSDSKDKTYADLNFELLGYLLEEVSGRPFDELMNDFLSNEMGMMQSYFLKSEKDTLPPIQGYQKTWIWKRFKENPFRSPVTPYPSSGMISTAEDLTKALIQLSRGSLGRLQPELEWLNNLNNNKIAGFQLIPFEEKVYLGHFGAQNGFSALLVVDPENGEGLVILSNTRDEREFRITLAKQLIPFLKKKH